MMQDNRDKENMAQKWCFEALGGLMRDPGFPGM